MINGDGVTKFGSRKMMQQGCSRPVVVLDHGMRAEVRWTSTNAKEIRMELDMALTGEVQ
jgi:hypothetical protein